MADNFLFSNFTYNPSTYYFFYVGDIKTYGLNSFLQDALARNYRKKVEFIAIVPDILIQYNYRNLIVINPLVDEYRSQNGSQVSYGSTQPVLCVLFLKMRGSIDLLPKYLHIRIISL